MGKQIKCKYCKKITINKKFCSHKCHTDYDKKHKLNRFSKRIQGKWGKLGGTQTHKLHPNLASKMGKKNIQKTLRTCKREEKIVRKV